MIRDEEREGARALPPSLPRRALLALPQSLPLLDETIHLRLIEVDLVVADEQRVLFDKFIEHRLEVPLGFVCHVRAIGSVVAVGDSLLAFSAEETVHQQLGPGWAR